MRTVHGVCGRGNSTILYTDQAREPLMAAAAQVWGVRMMRWRWRWRRVVQEMVRWVGE